MRFEISKDFNLLLLQTRYFIAVPETFNDAISLKSHDNEFNSGNNDTLSSVSRLFWQLSSLSFIHEDKSIDASLFSEKSSETRYSQFERCQLVIGTTQIFKIL